MVEREPIAALCSLIPVAFIRAPVHAKVPGILEVAGVVAIPTSDWEQRKFTADPTIVKQAFRLGACQQRSSSESSPLLSCGG